MSTSTKAAIGMAITFGVIVLFVWNSVPRLMRDVWHSRDFVPAQSHVMTDYKCTTWNVVMFNECTAKFVSAQSGTSQEFTDWRFGWAPSERARLMQQRDNASAVTTDVSLRTLWNRVALALTLVLFGSFLAIALMFAAMKGDDEPAAASN